MLNQIKKHPYLSVWFLFVILTVVYNKLDINPTVKVEVTIIDKLEGNGKSSQFYLIARLPNGNIDDSTVSPATYSQARIGDVYIWKYTQSQLEGEGQSYWIQFFAFMFLAMGLCMTPFAWFMSKFD